MFAGEFLLVEDSAENCVCAWELSGVGVGGGLTECQSQAGGSGRTYSLVETSFCSVIAIFQLLGFRDL